MSYIALKELQEELERKGINYKAGELERASLDEVSNKKVKKHLYKMENGPKYRKKEEEIILESRRLTVKDFEEKTFFPEI
jgi:hypothetical protein